MTATDSHDVGPKRFVYMSKMRLHSRLGTLRMAWLPARMQVQICCLRLSRSIMRYRLKILTALASIPARYQPRQSLGTITPTFTPSLTGVLGSFLGPRIIRNSLNKTAQPSVREYVPSSCVPKADSTSTIYYFVELRKRFLPSTRRAVCASPNV